MVLVDQSGIKQGGLAQQSPSIDTTPHSRSLNKPESRGPQNPSSQDLPSCRSQTKTGSHVRQQIQSTGQARGVFQAGPKQPQAQHPLKAKFKTKSTDEAVGTNGQATAGVGTGTLRAIFRFEADAKRGL